MTDSSNSSSPEGTALVDIVEFPEFVVEEASASRPKFAAFKASSTSTSRGTFSSILGLVGLGSSSQELAVPKSVVSRRDDASPIQVSISPQLDTLAAVHHAAVQIRYVKDKFRSVKAAWTFPPNSFTISSWRTVSWHPSGKLLLVNNFSEVFILRSNATLLFRISSVFLGLEDGICDALLRAWNDDSRSELIVLGFNKVLLRLHFNTDGSGKISSTAEFSKDEAVKSSLRLEPYLHAVSSLSLSRDGKAVLIGGALERGNTQDPRASSPICAFELLDGPTEYYRRLYPSSPVVKQAPEKGLFGFTRAVKSQEGPMVERIRFSRSGSHFVVLDSSPSFSIWDSANLSQIVVWSADSISRFFGLAPGQRPSISDIDWWDNDSIALVELGGKLRLLPNIVANKGVAPLFAESIPMFRPDSSLVHIEAENIVAIETFTKEARVPENFKFSTEDTSVFKLYLNDAATYVGLDLDPTPIGPKLIPKQFRFAKLTAIRASTPERLLYSKLETGAKFPFVTSSFSHLFPLQEFEFALNLAREHGLSTDFVYQKQFASHSVTETTIQASLVRVKDLTWVLDECKQRVPQSKEGLKSLLSFGIHSTEAAKSTNPIELAFVSLYRQIFVRFQERLALYLRLVKGAYRAEEFLEFRSRDLANVCVSLIENGEIERAKELLEVEEVASLRLEIISQVSPTINPVEYEALLPTASSSSLELASPQAKVPADLSEALGQVGIELSSTDIRSLLHAFALLTFQKIRGRKASIEEALHLTVNSSRQFESKDVYARAVEVPEKPLIDSKVSTLHSVVDWYLNRARQLESSAGLLQNAMALVEAGLRKCPGEESLLHLLDGFKGYRVVIYDLGKLDLPFADFSKLSQQKRFVLYLSKSSPENVTMQIRTFVQSLIPKEKFQALLAEWLQEQAREGQLDLCFSVFDESHFANAEANIISPLRQVLSVVIDCLYTCEAASPQTWAAMEALLSVIPSPPSNDSSGEEEYVDVDTNVLFTEVDLVEERLKVMKLLSSYGVNKPLHSFREKWTKENPEEVTDLISRLCQSGVRARPPWKQSQWQKLLADLQFIVDTCFGFLGPSFAKFQYFKTLLKANHLSLAREFVREEGSQLSGVDALVFDAAREHFNSCILLDDESLSLMMEILKLIPKATPELKAELELIEAAKRIQRISTSILPAQIRLAKNKLDIIGSALDANAKAYLQQTELVDIYALLGQKSPSHKVEVLGLVAQKAYDLGDFKIANSLCNDLIAQGSKNTSNLALSLGRDERNSDLTKRADFLSFALLHCDVAEIGELLKLREGILIRQDLAKLKLAPALAEKLSASPSANLVGDISSLFPTPVSQPSVDHIARLGFFETNPKNISNARSTTSLPPQYSLLLHKIVQALESVPQSDKENVIKADLLSLRDRAFVALSGHSLRKDIALYITYLSEVRNDETVFSHFKEETSAKDSKHSEIVTSLACYFYALKFLDSITRKDLVRKNLPNLPEWSALPNFSAASLVGIVVSAFFESNGDLKALTQSVPSDHASLAFLKRCRQFYTKLSDFVAVKELSELSNQIDVARFGSDETYRHGIVREQCHSMKEGALEKALKLAEKYRVTKFDMLSEFVRWALIEGYKSFLKDVHGNSVSRPIAVNESVAALESAITPYVKELVSITPVNSSQGSGPSATLFVARLKLTLSEVNGLHYEALHFLFSLIRRCLPHTATQEIVRYDLFLQILPRLKKISFLHRVDFKKLLLGPSEAREEIAAQIDPQNVSVYAKLLPALVPIWKQTPSHSFNLAELEKITESSVYYLLVKSLVFGSADPDLAIKSDSFENRRAEDWSTLLDVIRPYFEKLDATDLFDLASSLTIAPPSHKIGVNVRNKLIGDLAAHSKPPNELLVAIKLHLSLLGAAEKALMNIEGLNVDQALLALDLAFDKRDQVLELIVGLALNGLATADAMLLFDKLRPLNQSLAELTVAAFKPLLSALLAQLSTLKEAQDAEALDRSLEAAKKSSELFNRSLTLSGLSPSTAFIALTSFLDSLSTSLQKISNKVDLESVTKALMAQVFKFTESDTVPKESPLRLRLIAFLVARPSLYLDQSSLLQTHSKHLGSAKSKSVIGEIAAQMGASEADVESFEGREKLFQSLLAQFAAKTPTAPPFEKLCAILLHWTTETSPKGGLSPYHALWARLFGLLIERKQCDEAVVLLKKSRRLSIQVLSDEEADKLETSMGALTACAKFSICSLLSEKVKAAAVTAYTKHIASKKDLVFGEDFDEKLLALVIEEGLVGKLAASKLAPLLCDFVLIALDRASSSGSSPDLLNLPLLITPRVLAAYERIHSAWKSRPFDAYLHFAVTCAQLLEVKHLPWLSHLVLGYRRIPAAKSSIEHAVALLGPFCDELSAHCEQIGLSLGLQTEGSDEDEANSMAAVAERCNKFTTAAKNLVKGFGL